MITTNELNEYTGRQIAIFTDAHALYEPTEAILEDMHSRGITEIYSLGDNIGVGPNPCEVMNLLQEYDVKSIAGNSEDYYTMGIEPFAAYFDPMKTASYIWTLSKLNQEQLGLISLFPHSIELLVGGKNLALVHFANDVRIDYDVNSTFKYQRNYMTGSSAYRQFLYTNSEEQLKKVDYYLNKYGINSPIMRGFLSAKNEPLFALKRVEFFDAVIQGHVHFKIYEETNQTNYYTIRAAGMAYSNPALNYFSPIDTASYIILHEKQVGYDLEEVLVKYDREKMISSILSSENPDKFTASRFTAILKRQ